MKRILVISQNDLLLTGIKHMLRQNLSYSVRTSVTLDEEEIIRQIKQTDLDVIILEVNTDQSDTERLARMMNASNHLRVLTLEINSNQIQIYDKREITLHVSEDLVTYL